MEKVISVFIDESGDFGFVGDASKYYLITFIFYNQKDDISVNKKTFFYNKKEFNNIVEICFGVPNAYSEHLGPPV